MNNQPDGGGPAAEPPSLETPSSDAEELAPALPPKRTVAEIAASCNNVVRLVGPETPHIEVLLVGTAHISYASVLQVQQVLCIHHGEQQASLCFFFNW